MFTSNLNKFIQRYNTYGYYAGIKLISVMQRSNVILPKGRYLSAVILNRYTEAET